MWVPYLFLMTPDKQLLMCLEGSQWHWAIWEIITELLTEHAELCTQHIVWNGKFLFKLAFFWWLLLLLYYLSELEKVTCTLLFIILCQGIPLLVVTTFLTYLHNKKLDLCSFDLTASFGTVCSIPMHLYSYMFVLLYSSLFRPAYSFMFLKLLSTLGSKPVSSLLSYLYSTDIVL